MRPVEPTTAQPTSIDKLNLFKAGRTESLIETFHTSAGLNGLLLSGIERMTFGTDFHLEGIGLLGGTGLEFSSAGASYVNYLVIGMYFFFHSFTS